MLRMDNVGIVVEDLAPAIEFFRELGMELEGQATIDGEWAGRVTGLPDQRVEIAMLRTPDGQSRIELSRFDAPLVKVIREAEALTAGNQRFNLTVAANYGGRWDIMNAMSRLMARDPERRDGFSEDELASELSMHFAPEPDLFIRTGGEKRISNFLLWQLAYTELYFTDSLWPEFNKEAVDAAIASFQQRERRFGRTSEQVQAAAAAEAAVGVVGRHA